MDPEICDYYEPESKKNKICKYFTGNEKKQREIDRCRYYCTILETKRLMEDGQQVMERHKGALRRK